MIRSNWRPISLPIALRRSGRFSVTRATPCSTRHVTYSGTSWFSFEMSWMVGNISPSRTIRMKNSELLSPFAAGEMAQHDGSFQEKTESTLRSKSDRAMNLYRDGCVGQRGVHRVRACCCDVEVRVRCIISQSDRGKV